MFRKKMRDILVVSLALVIVIIIALREHLFVQHMDHTQTTPPLHTTETMLPAQPIACEQKKVAPVSAPISDTHISKPEDKQTQEPKKKRARTARRRKKEEVVITIQPEPMFETIPKSAAQTPQEYIVPAPIKEEATTTTAAQTAHTITVRNKIDSSALAVKHWTGTYYPTKLEITLNNVPFTIVGKDALTLDAIQVVQSQNNTITATYTYEFLGGMRKGSDTITYTLVDQPSNLELNFLWDTPWHIELVGAQRIELKN